MTTLAEFNAAPAAVVARLLDTCLDIDTWVATLVADRPYHSVPQLLSAADAAGADITWSQVVSALARHPRIGEKSQGSAADQALSATEQAGVGAGEVDAFAAGNRAYEDRFGFIFLICAAGLSGEQMLAALAARMANDPETEHSVVISELRKIAHLRLTKAVSP